MADDLRALSSKWFEEVWNQGDPDAIDRMMAEDAVAHGLGEAGYQGRSGFKALQALYRGAFPDLRISVEEVIQEGDLAACRFTCRGTHQGDTLGLEPTGRPVEFSGMSLTRWKDGRIVEGWNHVDFGTMQAQLAAE